MNNTDRMINILAKNKIFNHLKDRDIILNMDDEFYDIIDSFIDTSFSCGVEHAKNEIQTKLFDLSCDHSNWLDRITK